MLHYLLSCILLTFTAVGGREDIPWSSWTECEPASSCFKRRVIECIIDSVKVVGVRCGLLDGRQVFEQIAQTGCTDDCTPRSEWISPMQSQTCNGDCYDGSKVNSFRCASAINTCRLREFVRCYNEDSCSGTWTRTGSPSECSANCGGGTQGWNETCLDDEGQPSYNCNGTGGDPALSSTAQGNTTTRQVVETCNNQPCVASTETIQTVTTTTTIPRSTESTTSVQDGLIIPISAASGGVILLGIIIIAIVLMFKNKQKKKNPIDPKPPTIESFPPPPPPVDLESNNDHLGSNEEYQEINKFAHHSAPTQDYDKQRQYETSGKQEYSTAKDAIQTEYDKPTEHARALRKENSQFNGASPIEKTQANNDGLSVIYSTPTKPQKKKAPKKPPPFVENKNITEGVPETENDLIYSIPKSPTKLPEVYDKLHSGSGPDERRTSRGVVIEQRDTEGNLDEYDKLSSNKRSSLVQGGEESKNVYNIPTLPSPPIIEYSHLQLPLPDSIPEDEYSEVDRMDGAHVTNSPGSIDNFPAEGMVESRSDSSWSSELWSDENNAGLSYEEKMKVKQSIRKSRKARNQLNSQRVKKE